jgi:hypothetical protein
MTTKSFEKGMTWGGLAIAGIAAIAFTLVSSAGAEQGSGGPAEKHTQIRLAVDREGTLERVTLVDLHDMAVGETRSLATENGRPVSVTRDETGFDVDVDGKTVRVEDRFSEIPDGDGNVRFEKRVMIGDGEEGGEPRTMIFHGSGDEPQDVVVLRRSGPGGDHAFAFATDGAELPPLPFGVEATIARLEQNAKFQELDAATRAKVLEALRESAPQLKRIARQAPGEAGARVMVIETDDEETTP